MALLLADEAGLANEVVSSSVSHSEEESLLRACFLDGFLGGFSNSFNCHCFQLFPF